MTSAPMIAVTVILIACIVAILIAMIFSILDTLEKKNCSHFCHICKYRNICDWYNYKRKKLK